MSNLEKSLELLDKFLAENDKAAIEKIIRRVETNSVAGVPLSEYFFEVNTLLNPDNFLNFEDTKWDYTYIVKSLDLSRVKTTISDAFDNNTINYPMANAA